jgi:hypothetical protein
MQQRQLLSLFPRSALMETSTAININSLIADNSKRPRYLYLNPYYGTLTPTMFR